MKPNNGDSAHRCHDAGHLSPEQSARCRLLKAAGEVFAQKGYATASVREIVERAGLTKPALYYHFGSKEGILLAIVDEAFRVMASVVAEAAASTGSVRERTLRVCEAVVQLAHEHRTEHRVAHIVYFSAADSLPHVDFARAHSGVLSQVEALIQAGIDSGEIRPVDPIEAALALLGAVAVCSHDEDIRPEDRFGTTNIRGLHAIIFDGLCRVP
jgi:TetR/AcrR family transcriptional regulator